MYIYIYMYVYPSILYVHVGVHLALNALEKAIW